MKIYVNDFGWAGSITVVAASMEDAVIMMKENTDEIIDESEIMEFDVVPGCIHVNYGAR
jgi:hypothetical protein